MSRHANALIVGVLSIAAGIAVAAQSGQPAAAPDWAYGYLGPLTSSDRIAPPCPPTAKPFPDCAYVGGNPPDGDVKRTLPGTSLSFSRNEVFADFGPADWYPEDHPPMPPIVARGKEAEGVRPCSLCHYPNGQGKMENGHVAGLSAAYILSQLEAFKSGARKSADPRKANTNEMAGIARSLTPEEAKAAAEYFAAQSFRPWVKVVEAEEAPGLRRTQNGLFLAVPGAAPIPLNGRIIEMAADAERMDTMRDPRTGFITYVPVGSVAKGEELAKTGGGGKTMQCALCHGPELKGSPAAPPIAGRTASYTMRQLWDMKQGTRKSPIMAPVVAKLSLEELTALTAYVASRQP